MTAYRAELLGPLAALGLGPAEEVGQLRIPLTFGVLDIGLQAQGVAQAGLGEPDDVVILVLGAGDVPGLVATGHMRLPRELLRPQHGYPDQRRAMRCFALARSASASAAGRRLRDRSTALAFSSTVTTSSRRANLPRPPLQTAIDPPPHRLVAAVVRRLPHQPSG